jgi:hypothetical protein
LEKIEKISSESDKSKEIISEEKTKTEDKPNDQKEIVEKSKPQTEEKPEPNVETESEFKQENEVKPEPEVKPVAEDKPIEAKTRIKQLVEPMAQQHNLRSEMSHRDLI